jgi:hypothetical protein
MKKVILLVLMLGIGLFSVDCNAQQPEPWQTEILENLPPTPPRVWVPGYWGWTTWAGVLVPVYHKGYWKYEE